MIHEIDVTLVKSVETKKKRPKAWHVSDSKLRFCKLRKVHVSSKDCNTDCRNRILAGYTAYHNCAEDNLI